MAASSARRPSRTAPARSARKVARPQPKATAKSTKRAATGAGSDYQKIVDMLTKDHAEVAKLFKKFAKLKKADDDSRYEYVQEACKALEIHAAIEEQHFYPAARAASGEGEKEEDMLDEAEVEHIHIKELVSELKDADEDDPLCDAKVKVLCEYVTHHVKEEETELFPKLRKFKEAFDGVYDKMVEQRKQMESSDSLLVLPGPTRASERDFQGV